MKIDVIIPTLKNNSPYVENCLSSLENSVNAFNPIIMENGKDADLPQGQCGAVNEGLKQVTTEYVMVANDDMYFPASWDRDIVLFDCFSPNLVEPVDNAGSAPPFIKLDAGLNLEVFNSSKVEEIFEENEDSVIENGFNLPFIIRTDLFRKIGGYDEMYDPWGSNSDSDLQYKLSLAGVQPKRNRGMLVYHFSNKSGTFEPEQRAYWQRNWDYFVEKWGFDREDSPDIWYHNLHIPLKKLKYKPEWSIYA